MGNDPTATIQSLLNAHATEHIGVVAGIISPDVPQGSALLFGGTSLWNTQHQPLTLDGNTLFKLASVTKTFTSVAQFAIHKNYDGTLGDRITVPDKPLPPGLATLPIFNLANYSPGFSTDNQGGWVPKNYLQNLPNLLTFLTNGTDLPQNTPGTCYSYSNFGWALLAIAALGVTDESENIYERWKIFIAELAADLGFTNTAPYDPSMNPNLPVGYKKNGTMLPVGANYGLGSPMLFGAGGVVTTGNDMLKWLAFNMGLGQKRPMNMFTLQQVQTWQLQQCPPDQNNKPPVVSLCWFHRTETINGQPVTYLNKDGAHMGFTSWMGFESWVESGHSSSIGCFVLTNSVGASQLGPQIINILFGKTDAVVATDEVHYVEPDEEE